MPEAGAPSRPPLAAAGPSQARARAGAGEPAPAPLWRRAARNRRVQLGGGFVLLTVLVALLAPRLAPYDPNRLLGTPLLPPGPHHLLGTDDFGRDELSRMLYGARVSLAVSALSVALAAVLGIPLGLLAGYYRGVAETVIMRAADVVLSFPTIVLAIAVVGILGPSFRDLVLVIGLVYAPPFVRIVYGSTLREREAEYVQAAQALGAGELYVIFRVLLPNVLAPVLVQGSLGLGLAVLVEAGLSFLGLGTQPPTPSWGAMVAVARNFLTRQPLLLIWPSIAVSLLVLAFNTLGDGLRDVLDPRMKT
jgi:peptide/nickel transport system permease protein